MGTTSQVIKLLSGAAAIVVFVMIVFLPTEQPEHPTPPTKPAFDRAALQECLTDAKATYDLEITDWNRRFSGDPPDPGAIDPFERAREYYDGERYRCYTYFGAEPPADLLYIRKQTEI